VSGLCEQLLLVLRHQLADGVVEPPDPQCDRVKRLLCSRLVDPLPHASILQRHKHTRVTTSITTEAEAEAEAEASTNRSKKRKQEQAATEAATASKQAGKQATASTA
jgi:hypothetical protein